MLFYFTIVEQISLIVSRPLHFKEQNSSIIGQGEERERRGRGSERKGEERKGRERKGEEGRGEKGSEERNIDIYILAF